MNAFNRLVLVLMLLSVAVAAIGVAVLSWTLPEDSIAVLTDATGWLEDNYGGAEKVLATTGSLLLALIAMVLLTMELSPGSGREVKVTDLQGGEAYLSTDSIGQRIEEAVTRVPSITDVKATVEARAKGVKVTLDLHVEPQANVAIVTDDACRATREVLANQVHVALIDPPLAHLHYREAALSRAGVARRSAAALPADVRALTPPRHGGDGQANGRTDLAAAVESAYKLAPVTPTAGSEPAASVMDELPTENQAHKSEQDMPPADASGEPALAASAAVRRVSGPAGEFAVDEYGRVINLTADAGESAGQPARRESA